MNNYSIYVLHMLSYYITLGVRSQRIQNIIPVYFTNILLLITLCSFIATHELNIVGVLVTRPKVPRYLLVFSNCNM